MHEPSDHEGAEPDAARRTRRWRVGVSLGILVLATVGAVTAFVAGLSHRPGHHIPWGALVAVLAALVLLLGATGLVLWQLLNQPAYQRVGQYHWRRRNRVAKALRRGDPISPEDLAVADALVGVMRKQRVFLWFQPVLIASWILMAFARHGLGRWLYAGLALAMGVALVYAVRVQRRILRNWDARSTGRPGIPHDIVDE
jgi:hypothetical protein